MYAAAEGYTDVVTLLLAKGAEVNVVTDGRKVEAKVKELLAAGADPNHEYVIGYAHKTIKGRVLVLAASLGHPGIVQLLLNKGADVNAKGLISGSEHGLNYGTALEAAERANKPEVVALLRNVRPD